MQPFLKSLNVMRCPDNNFADFPVEGDVEKAMKMPRSYSMNGAAPYDGVSDARITSSWETIRAVESRYEYPDYYPSGQNRSSFLVSVNADGTPDFGGGRADKGSIQTHGDHGLTNLIFFDGHAKALRLVQTLDGNRPLTMWQYRLSEPQDHTDQAGEGAIRETWRKQITDHAEYR